MIHHTSFSHNNKLLPPHRVFGGGRQSPLSDRPVVGRSASPPPSAEDAEADVAKEAEVAKAADSSAAFIGDGSISIETWCDCKVQN